jgi:methionine biosynthesis protein MetW
MDIANHQKRIYEKIEFESYPEHRFEKFFPYLRCLNNPKILDLGCGRGQIYDVLKNCIKDFHYTGVDVAEKHIKDAQKRGLDVFVADVSEGLSFEDHIFDVIIAAEIIEHVFDTDAFLQECHRLLKKQGILILTTPNIASKGSRVALLFGKRPKTIDFRAINRSQGHIRAFVKKDLVTLFKENNFSIISLMGKDFNLPFIKYGTKLEFINKFFCKLFPTLSSGFIIIATTKND